MLRQEHCQSHLNDFAYLLIIAIVNLSTVTPGLGQTVPAQLQQIQSPPSDSPTLSSDGRQTQCTVANAYDDAIGNMLVIDRAVPVNQQNINDGVQKILTGHYAPLVFQAAEQGQGTEIQKTANNVLNASFGSVNDTYRGMHQWFKDDFVLNLVPNAGQLLAKWMSEFLDGWVADAAQFLAKVLRVFVLNPNIAVNGLGGTHDDGISKYIRQGADVMYGIAVDLLLLFFILCIWKFWADAAWHGKDNLMGAVGRLIFTSGLLIAWPTIYAFEIQISNEMIRAIYFSSADQVRMLDYALAQAVRGGVLAAGQGVLSVLAPVAGKLAMATSGKYVGAVFSFGSTLIYVVLGGMLVSELIYILILKAIQTALLTAQYMFAPVFLVCFATPDTEGYATGFVKAFVETSLWTFIWVGLLKVMTIILFSDFNPWGKVLVSIGVLQIMIQVPGFLGRAQISPVSEFVTPKLVFGAISKTLSGLSTGLSSAMDDGVSWFSFGRYNGLPLPQSQEVSMNRLSNRTATPELLNSLNKKMDTSKSKSGFDSKTFSGGSPALSSLGAAGLGAAGLGATGLGATGLGATGLGATGLGAAGFGAAGLGAAGLGAGTEISTATGGAGLQQSSASVIDGVGTASNAQSASARSTSGIASRALCLPTTSAAESGAGTQGCQPEGAGGISAASQASHSAEFNGEASSEAGGYPDRYHWANLVAQGCDSGDLKHVNARKFLAKLSAINGMRLRAGQEKNSVTGNTSTGVQQLNLVQGGNSAEMSRGIYAAAFADNVATDDPAKDAARRSAINARKNGPRGLLENMCANWLSASGSSWNDTTLAKERFQQSMFEEAVNGSQAYIVGQAGNAYTDYLRGRYGSWGADQDAEARYLISNSDSSETSWNRNIGPAAESLLASGIPLDKDTGAAIHNSAFQAMHPARRKQAVFAALSYTYPKAKALYGNEDQSVFKLAHGELTRALSANEVNNALAMYQITGQDDICSAMASQYMSTISAYALTTDKEFPLAYRNILAEAPYAAERLAYLAADQRLAGIHSFSDLAAVIQANHSGESSSFLMSLVLHEAVSTLKARSLNQ